MFVNQIENNKSRSVLSLYELNNLVRTVVQTHLPTTYWLRAEMSDVRVNVTSGHCYLEFVEKEKDTGVMIARARASIWSKTFCMLKPYFESVTGQKFASGLKVLVKVSVDLHELYGYSLTVLDIDPTYTLGDMARKKMEIVSQLKREGVFDLNRELPFPVLPQRIAVITSPTAAGWGDFIKQLTDNKKGFVFYWKLFPAFMQGEKTEESIIAALDLINQHLELFDVVVIIRGGGATSELHSFDSYLLASNCAQFPLPIITGIGHERDDTVVDMVVHTRMKTPTAVAGFLIDCMDNAYRSILQLQQVIIDSSTNRLQQSMKNLQILGNRFRDKVMNKVEIHRSMFIQWERQLPKICENVLRIRLLTIKNIQQTLKDNVNRLCDKEKHFIVLTDQFIKMVSPEYVLKRGYSLTLKEGKIIKSAKMFKKGDCLITKFYDGQIRSIVENNNEFKKKK